MQLTSYEKLVIYMYSSLFSYPSFPYKLIIIDVARSPYND
jgi:hypothetical protein